MQEETLRKLYSVYGPGAAKRVPDTSEGETMATSIGMIDPAYLVSEASCRAPDVLFSVLSCRVRSSPVLSCAVICCAVHVAKAKQYGQINSNVRICLLYTSPSPRD